MAQIEEAKQSNDVVKMRSALDQAEGALAIVKDHMAMCSGMMQGGMGGMMRGGMTKQAPSKPPTSTDHAKHH